MLLQQDAHSLEAISFLMPISFLPEIVLAPDRTEARTEAGTEVSSCNNADET
jgi:hypothetical protein